MRTLPAIAIVVALLSACSASIPTRFVLERDVGGWSYRRYQRVLDVEVAIEGNPAVGHTATYVQRASRQSSSVPFASVFVSVYEEPRGLSAEVRRVMRSLASYDAEVRAYGGGHVWYLDAGEGDRWALWVSGPHVVKVGAGGELERVPEELVATYMGIYPSDLDEHGRARAGTRSEGELEEETSEGSGDPGSNDEVPGFLRENAPR
jgi:hypothetical protein